MLITSFIGHSENRQPLNQSFDDFPKTIGKWHGKKSQLDTQVIDMLGLDDYVLMNYISPDRRHVNLYIGYFEYQGEGKGSHSPKNCMPGGGWNIIGSDIQEISFQETDRKIEVIKLTLQKGSERQIVLYWYQGRDRIIASEYWQKIWLVIDSIFRQRTDESFVRLISRVNGSEEKTLETLKEFARMISPYLNEYIPS